MNKKAKEKKEAGAKVDEHCGIDLDTSHCTNKDSIRMCEIPLKALVGKSNDFGIIVDNTAFPMFEKNSHDGNTKIVANQTVEVYYHMEEKYLNLVILFSFVALVMIVAAIFAVLIFIKYNKELKEMQSIIKDNQIYTKTNLEEKLKEE